MDGFQFVIEHGLGESRVGSQEQRLIHDAICARKVPDNPECVRVILAKLNECRLADKIAAE